MPTTVDIPLQNKRSSVEGKVPQAGDLREGQLAINLADRKIYTKDGSGAIIQLGVASSDLKTVAFTGQYADLLGLPTIPDPYTLPEATAGILGGIKLGLGLSMDGSGVVTPSVLSVKGQYGSVKTGDVELTRLDLGLDILDPNGKIYSEYLPASISGAIVFQGTWDANLNTPEIPAASVNNNGYYYVVRTAGTTNIDGVTSWAVGDLILSDGIRWTKIVGAATTVVSINGASGIVVLDATNLPGLSTVGRTGQYLDLLGLPTSFVPQPHTQSISTIPDASLVAASGQYADLLGLPPDPRIKNIGVSVSGTPVIFAVTYIFTQKIQFAQDFVGSKAAFALQAGVTTDVVIKKAIAMSPTVMVNVGKIHYASGMVTFTTENPAPITFDVGDVLQYVWSNANIATATITLLGLLQN